MADDDFSVPVPASGTVFRLSRRTVQLGVDPESLEATVAQEVRTFYGLDVAWTISAEVIKKIRQDGGAGTYIVWFRVTLTTEIPPGGGEEILMLITREVQRRVAHVETNVNYAPPQLVLREP